MLEEKMKVYKMQWRHSDRWIDDYVNGNEQQVIQKAVWRKERNPDEYIRVVLEENGRQMPVFFA
tara:strand:- start:205 stop:396 length:192 start_codon:yes stop_codon:yes gene_type:complete